VKALTATGTFVLGLVVGLSSVALHHYWWGLLLAIAASATTAYALPARWWARLPFAIGWVAMPGYLALPRDGGGFAIAGEVQGYALLGFAVALLVAAMVTLPNRRGSPIPDEPPP
jgi:hypothetical protein